jgi:hypothetical protein
MLKRTLFLALTITPLVMLAPLPVAAVPIISVGSYTPSTTDPFVVPIEITGAVDLVNWQFDLEFDPNDLQVNLGCDSSTDPYCDPINGPVTEGPFTSSNGQFVTLFIPGVVDNLNGLVSIIAGAYSDLPPNPSGDGVLAYVEFVTTANGTGDSKVSVTNASVLSVPEPATLALLTGGLVALLGVRRRARCEQSQGLWLTEG